MRERERKGKGGPTSGPREVAVIWGDDCGLPLGAWVDEAGESLQLTPLNPAGNWPPALSGSVELVRTVGPSYGARTRALPYHGSLAGAGDGEITGLVLDLLEADDSLLGAPLNQAACDWSRLESGEAVITDMPRALADEAVARVRAWLGKPVSTVVETRLRAVSRYHFHDYGLENQGTTALLAVSRGGFAIGLWSGGLGLVREFEEQFDAEAVAAQQGESELQGLERGVRYAVERLAALAREASRQGFAPPHQTVFAAEANMVALVETELEALARDTGVRSVSLAASLDEAVAQGLALGQLGAQPATINLARALTARRAEAEQVAVEAAAVVATQRGARKLFRVAAPWAVVLALIGGAGAWELFSAARVAAQARTADREASRLRPIAAERRAAVENARWFRSVIDQILERRSHRSAAVRLLDDLNARWPADDKSFYVRELTLGANGNLEIKGLTQHEESVTAFGHALEFSTALFEQVGTSIVSGMGNQGSAPAAMPATHYPPGVTGWTVKAIYKPMAGKAGKQ